MLNVCFCPAQPSAGNFKDYDEKELNKTEQAEQRV